MNAIVVLWHQYVPRGVTEHYRLYFEYFKKWLERYKDEFDTLHLVDSGWDFTTKDREDIDRILGPGRCTCWPFGDGHQWTHFKRIVPLLKEENIMLLDNDFYVYKKGAIKEAFDALEKDKKLVAVFDGSGGMEEVLWAKFPYLREKAIRRICSACFFVKRELLEGVSFDPIRYEIGTHIPELDYTTVEGDWLDAFGEAMVKVLSKIDEKDITFLPDDFSAIYLNDTRTIDGVETEDHNCGYFHMRNCSLALYLLNEKKNKDKSSYERMVRITPARECLRLLAWLWVIGEVCNAGPDLKKDITGVLKDFGVHDMWEEYIEKFKLFHSWVEL